MDLDSDQAQFEYEKAFTGCELVHDTHRLALMNAMLHEIEGKITLGDTLSPLGKYLDDYDVVLANPPFGTKIRANLMDKCNLHTILRLPTGIFYAQGVRTNVLFFTRGTTDKDNTKEVWFYDLRTNMPSFGKTNPLKQEHFDGFMKAYEAEDRRKVEDERWSVVSREEIEAGGDSLDLGLIKDDSIVDYEDLPDPLEAAENAADALEEAVDMLRAVAKELKQLEA